MKYIVFFIVTFLVISFKIVAQNITILKGHIYNFEDKLPISYVNIALKGTSLGTVTNEVGSFVFALPSSKTSYFKDSLIVSAIGYKTYSIKVGDILNDTLINIYLQPYTYLLKEVVVNGRANFATYIVEQMIKNIDNNYASKPYVMRGFYREASLQDTSYTRLIEAFVSIYDKGIKTNLEDMRIKVEELRKSDDNRDMDWFASIKEWLYEKNGLYSTLAKNRLKKQYSSAHTINETVEMPDTTQNQALVRRFLSNKFLSYMSFSLRGISYLDGDSIYHIDYEPIKSVIQTYKVAGTLYINASDFALIETNTKIFVNKEIYQDNPKISQNQRDRIIAAISKRTIDGYLFFETINKYKKHGSKYFLQYISYKGTGTNSSPIILNVKETINSKWEKGKFYQMNQFVITEIITDKDKINKISKSAHIDKKDDLYDLDMPYHIDFWKNAGFIPLSPISQKMLRDLEKEKSLEQQFIDNGD